MLSRYCRNRRQNVTTKKARPRTGTLSYQVADSPIFGVRPAAPSQTIRLDEYTDDVQLATLVIDRLCKSLGYSGPTAAALLIEVVNRFDLVTRNFVAQGIVNGAGLELKQVEDGSGAWVGGLERRYPPLATTGPAVESPVNVLRPVAPALWMPGAGPA
jgi:hypothetical protein